jgi:hypothetical protein
MQSCFLGIPSEFLGNIDSINTDAFDLKLLHSHCCQMIDCPLHPLWPLPLPHMEVCNASSYTCSKQELHNLTLTWTNLT